MTTTEVSPPGHEPDDDQPGERQLTLVKTLTMLVAVTIVVVAIAIVLAVISFGTYVVFWKTKPDSVPVKTDPGFLDLIFANAWVIFSARVVIYAAAVVLLFAGLYIVGSILVRISRREWLHEAGVLKAELATARSLDEDSADAVRDVLHEAWRDNERLSQELEEANSDVSLLLDGTLDLERQLSELQAELDELRGER